jgi:hypothetical protein
VPLSLQRKRWPAVDLNREYRECEVVVHLISAFLLWTYRSIRQQIIVPAQNSLDVNRRARSGIGICRARCEHTERPVIFSVLCDAVDRYFLDVMTAGLLSHFQQRSTLQFRH